MSTSVNNHSTRIEHIVSMWTNDSEISLGKHITVLTYYIYDEKCTHTYINYLQTMNIDYIVYIYIQIIFKTSN